MRLIRPVDVYRCRTNAALRSARPQKEREERRGSADCEEEGSAIESRDDPAASAENRATRRRFRFLPLRGRRSRVSAPRPTPRLNRPDRVGRGKMLWFTFI